MVTNRPSARTPVFKASQYAGKEDVKYFILLFEKIVVKANGRVPEAAILNLRESWKKGTKLWQGHKYTGYIWSFVLLSLSPRDAINRLGTLKKDLSTSLQEHAVQVQVIVGIAYAGLLEDCQHRMMLEAFNNMLGNSYSQRYMLVVATPNEEEDVRAGTEFISWQVDED